ncbi:germ cell-less protein-like 2 [Fukomys damarensis]|uniref:germ cell-less protein-like 2 n=1 Tax=Fukomys damarensis TaxID=885580 RepID=UPI00053FA212|nr:germ cell-less protein-like 2 [Fukomys damarensis]
MGLIGSRVLRCWEPDSVDLLQQEYSARPSSHISGSHKRKESSEHDLRPTCDSHRSENQEEYPQEFLSTSDGKRVKITSEYAYEKLFLNGENSDIKISALGKVWCLHKIYLCHSGYFANMFGGSSKELHKNMIELDINDKNIDVQSLHFVLGSLYRDECIFMEPFKVPNVLATAFLLQVENLIKQCIETMKTTINATTVCGYFAAAETYGLDSVRAECFEWLLHNLMTHPCVELYKEIGLELMNLLISSPDLLVMQVEIDIYTMLKQWMFLHLNPAWKGSMKELLANANNWFSRNRECIGNITFLDTEEGITFKPVFKNLRFQHIFCGLSAIRVIEQDFLIPSEWLSSVYKQQWFTFLKARRYGEIGPRDINETEFERYSMRCGKKIIKDGRYIWKWSGYNFGFPLHVIFTSHCIIFKQNTCNQLREVYSTLQPLRNIAFRLTLVSFDVTGRLSFSKTTGYKILTLKNDEERVIMKLDSIPLSFPLYIFCNFLFISLENTKNCQSCTLDNINT